MFVGSRVVVGSLPRTPTADALARPKRNLKFREDHGTTPQSGLRSHDPERGTETPLESGLLPSHDPTRAFTRHSSPRQPFPTLCAHVTALVRSRAAVYPSQILRNVCCLPGDGQSRAGDHTRG